MPPLCDKWMRISKEDFMAFSSPTITLKESNPPKDFSFSFQSLKRHVFIPVMGNELLKN